MASSETGTRESSKKIIKSKIALSVLLTYIYIYIYIEYDRYSRFIIRIYQRKECNLKITLEDGRWSKQKLCNHLFSIWLYNEWTEIYAKKNRFFYWCWIIAKTCWLLLCPHSHQFHDDIHPIPMHEENINNSRNNKRIFFFFLNNILSCYFSPSRYGITWYSLEIPMQINLALKTVNLIIDFKMKNLYISLNFLFLDF